MANIKDKTWYANSIVSITEDGMEAHLMLWPSAHEEGATAEELIMFIREKGIIRGILEEEIDRILREKVFLEDVIVAKGQPNIVGTDGRFEFFVEVERKRKPRILENGSVDYSNYNAIPLVKKDDLICKYIPGIKGQDGFDVRGHVIQGRKGQELKPIKGKGFYMTEDGLEYYANVDGRVDYSNFYMVVSHNLVVEGNVDHIYGDIDFVGDIEVKGDVFPNMTIKTNGFLVVEGHVESAHLIAGKGVILKNGMQGSGKGVIDCKGDVEGKFFEQTTIRCGGTLHANAILQCDITAEEGVKVEGTLGALVGGKTVSSTYVEAAYIGNMGNVATEIKVGTEADTESELQRLQDEVKTDTMELYKTDGKIKLIDEAGEKGLNLDSIADVKKQLLRVKISLKTSISEKEARINLLYKNIEKAFNAHVTASSQMYPGVAVFVNGMPVRIQEVVNSVTIKKLNDKVVMTPNTR